jgi:hypothetical protein
MKWTDDKPTVEGWYFWRANLRVTDPLHWAVEYVEPDIDVLTGQWAGPIPEPTDEKK